MNISEKIAKRIKKLRTEKSLTLEKLAWASDLSKSSLSNIEKARKEPRVSTLEKICKTLDISLSEFFIDIDKGDE